MKEKKKIAAVNSKEELNRAIPKGKKGFQKGKPKTGGRLPGTPNKLTSSAKKAFQRAFELIGGDEALAAWAKKNRTEFYKLYARLIPVEMEHSGSIEERVRNMTAEDRQRRLKELAGKINKA